MTRIRQVVSKHQFATIIFASACLGVLVGVLAWSGRAKRQEPNELSVFSKAAAIRVVASERTKVGDVTMLMVKLQNVSTKDIVAYIIASGNSWVTRNYYLTEERFAPGSIVNHLIPFSASDSQHFPGPFASKSGNLVVVAVALDDGSTEGDSRFIKMLSDEQAGARDQAIRIAPSLQVLATSGARERRSLSDLEPEILKLPDKAPGPFRSSDYENGLANAKRELLERIRQTRAETQANRPDDAARTQQKAIRVLQKLADSSPIH